MKEVLEIFSDQIFWYTVRATGIVAVIASGLSVLTGLLLSSRLLGVKPTIPWLTDLHRFFSSMVSILVVIHMVGLWADNFVTFDVLDLLVPGRAELNPAFPKKMALVFGVLAFWLLVIVEWTSFLKKYLPKKLWHSFHLLSFVVLGMSVVHGYQIGSDADNPIILSICASLFTAIFLVLLGRIIRKWQAVRFAKNQKGY